MLDAGTRCGRGDQLLESTVVADWIEVRVVLREGSEAGRHLDRAAEVLQRVGRPARLSQQATL